MCGFSFIAVLVMRGNYNSAALLVLFIVLGARLFGPLPPWHDVQTFGVPVRLHDVVRVFSEFRNLAPLFSVVQPVSTSTGYNATWRLFVAASGIDELQERLGVVLAGVVSSWICSPP